MAYRNHGSLLSWFSEFTPVEYAGESVHVFHISLDEANKVRQRLGWPQLPAGSTSVQD